MPHIKTHHGIRKDVVDSIRNMATTVANDHLRLRYAKQLTTTLHPLEEFDKLPVALSKTEPLSIVEMTLVNKLRGVDTDARRTQARMMLSSLSILVIPPL